MYRGEQEDSFREKRSLIDIAEFFRETAKKVHQPSY